MTCMICPFSADQNILKTFENTCHCMYYQYLHVHKVSTNMLDI